MKLNKVFYVFCIAIALLTGCATNQPVSVSNDGIVTLTDSPAIQFSASNWGYTNISNPFFLTPDYLTNAMVSISRLQPGEALLHEGPIIPDNVNTETLLKLQAKRLVGKNNLEIIQATMSGHSIALATYSDPEKKHLEYSFVLNGTVIYILVVAKEGDYYNSSKLVAENVIKTMRNVQTKI